MKYWEIIADNLKKRGWSLGYVSAVDCEGRTIWIADAHRDDGKRFVVRADEKLTAFRELQRITQIAPESLFDSYCSGGVFNALTCHRISKTKLAP
jgi:hypothetical protein